MAPDEEPEFLKVEEVAKRLRIGRNQAYAACEAGEIPGAVRIGRSWRIKRVVFEKFGSEE